MSRRTEEKMADLVTWYVEHKNEISDVGQQRKFQARALHELIHIFTYVIEDIQNLEGRIPGETSLVLPNQLRLDKKLREGGDQR